MKACSKCKILKDDGCFYKQKNGLRSTCKDCVKYRSTKYYQNNREDILSKVAKYQAEREEDQKEYMAQYYQNNREDILDRATKYQQENKEEIRKYKSEYRQKNKSFISMKDAEYKKKRLKSEPTFKFRESFSCLFRNYLKSNSVNKNRNSVFKILEYKPDVIRNHLESLFSHSDNLAPDGKVWMTWDNYGSYRVGSWNDNDPTTWRWQIDHIKPQSEFNCISIDDPKIKECWSLDNLRPLSAKQNQLDGATKIRHKKK